MNTKQGIEAIFKYATEGILLTNNKSEIIHINPSAENLFGYEEGELIGQKIEILIPKSKRTVHVGHRTKFMENSHPRAMGKGMALFGTKKDGSEFPVEVSLSPYETDEGKFVVCFIVDITLRQEAENKLKNYSSDLEKQVGNRTLVLREAITELEKTKNELNEALEKEKELNELKTRFVSMASHEFRTPLATIMSSLSLVKAYGEKNDTEKQNKHINKIKKSITILTDILNDFLSISKLEEGKVESEFISFDLVDFIKELLHELKALCKKNQIIDFQYQGKSNVILDKKMIKHILINLVSNAIKFSNEGSEIKIRLENINSHIDLEIEDQGIGISKSDQKYLFQRFFRARNASNIQGTGLGLNIVASYIDLMGGEISFDSEENKGTTFKIKLPNNLS
ncbi:MAG: PAS domain-containing sensor histidine kinase [Crocinitomicaceae bacterium]